MMKYSWLDLNKLFIVKREDTFARPSVGGIKELIANDEDYLLCIPTTLGEIYRFDEVGEVWGVYVKGSHSNSRWSLWRKLNDLGCEQVLVGDKEGSWKFPANKLLQVAKIVKARKRFTRKK